MSQETPAERIELRPHWRAFGVWYLAMLLLGTGPVSNPQAALTPLQGAMAVALIGLGVVLTAVTSRLTVTPDRIERQGGLLPWRRVSWPTSDLAGVRIVAGLSSRVLGVGTLYLEPRQAGPAIRFWGVHNPKKAGSLIKGLAGIEP